jgi:type II secretory pathway pseudopilin PulG
MTNEQGGKRRSGKPKSTSRVTTFTGVLASIATIVAAGASVIAAHQTSRVDQLTVIVRQQQEQLRKSGSPATTGRTSSTGGATPGGGTYLSALQPTVDNADFGTGPQIMSARNYTNSVTFDCDGTFNSDQPDEAFNIAGHQLFRATVGIPDNTSDATSLNETVTFANQSGDQLLRPVVVSLGKPAFVRINVSRVTQLEVTCSGVDPQTQQNENGNSITLGDASISGR